MLLIPHTTIDSEIPALATSRVVINYLPRIETQADIQILAEQTNLTIHQLTQYVEAFKVFPCNFYHWYKLHGEHAPGAINIRKARALRNQPREVNPAISIAELEAIQPSQEPARRFRTSERILAWAPSETQGESQRDRLSHPIRCSILRLYKAGIEHLESSLATGSNARLSELSGMAGSQRHFTYLQSGATSPLIPVNPHGELLWQKAVCVWAQAHKQQAYPYTPALEQEFYNSIRLFKQVKPDIEQIWQTLLSHTKQKEATLEKARALYKATSFVDNYGVDPKTMGKVTETLTTETLNEALIEAHRSDPPYNPHVDYTAINAKLTFLYEGTHHPVRTAEGIYREPPQALLDRYCATEYTPQAQWRAILQASQTAPQAAPNLQDLMTPIPLSQVMRNRNMSISHITIAGRSTPVLSLAGVMHQAGTAIDELSEQVAEQLPPLGRILPPTDELARAINRTAHRLATVGWPMPSTNIARFLRNHAYDPRTNPALPDTMEPAQPVPEDSGK